MLTTTIPTNCVIFWTVNLCATYLDNLSTLRWNDNLWHTEKVYRWKIQAYKELLPEVEYVSQRFLGNPAYLLLPNMMKEFEYCISNEEFIFNQMFHRSRNQIECEFIRLKARWRILMRPMNIFSNHLPCIIFACFILCNFCEKEKVDVDLYVVDQVIRKDCHQIKIDKVSS